MRRWKPMSLLVMLLLLASPLSAYPVTYAATATESQSPEPESSVLEVQVRAWVQSLSQQEGFTHWQQAETNITPIGPGQHGWLVTLRNASRQPVGYLIVHAKEYGGFALTEYGNGRHPAFDPNTLYQSMVQQGLISSFAEAAKRPLKLERLYVHPLLAVWKWYSPDGQIYYLDAWTGEALPINEAAWNKAVQAYQNQGQTVPLAASGSPLKVSLTRTNPVFDAYETMPWLTKQPLDKSKVAIMSSLLDKRAKIRFTSELYDGQVLFVWPAVGYQKWNGNQLYIAFDQYGTRYVPMNALAGKGSFFNE